MRMGPLVQMDASTKHYDYWGRDDKQQPGDPEDDLASMHETHLADTSARFTPSLKRAYEGGNQHIYEGEDSPRPEHGQLSRQICTASTHSRSESLETTPKFDGREIFCDSTKTDPIPWFCKFELKLQLHHVSEHKHHTYLYSRSGGACQVWLDNLLSKYEMVAADLHTKINWDGLKAAWHKSFQVEPLEIKIMDKLMTFEQGTLSSVDRIVECQRLTFVPYIQKGFNAVKHYFISRSCSALGNALTHVKDTLTTTAELFERAAQIIVMNKEAKNLHCSSTTDPSRDQHRPKATVVVAATPTDQSSEVVSANEGDRLTATRDVGLPDKGRGRGKTKTNTASIPGPGAAARSSPMVPLRFSLCSHLHTYLSFNAPPTSPMDDEVAVGDILAYVTKVVRESRKQQYDENNAPLLYVRIQVGQVSCSALLDSGASRNFMSQAFMQRADLGAQVRRKANLTTIKLADGRTQQLIDRYIEVVPVYFAPPACEPVTVDILDTDFDVILGMLWLASADHAVNFHRRTLTIRDAFGAKVSCTIPLPHPSIRCQVVTTKSFRATCAYEQPDEIGLCFLRTVVVADSSPTDLSSDPRVVWLLDEFAHNFESPTGGVPDRPISHEIFLEAGVVPPKGCIYRMTEEELTVLRAQLDNLLDKGWIRPSSSPYGAPVLFVRKKNKDLRLCIDFASTFGGPTFSATSHAIASHARFVDAVNHATIVRTASCDHYRSPCAEGKRLSWTLPGRSPNTSPVWMRFLRWSTDS
ncbi:hypothetical protein CBR_g37277 [Chara braunii]|uniref:Reverse transcriptase/retrotransposon-derived protein RNase H-like domain-containing protein n=1 Tax=Chara braunii TaxID=69332 RepID=A0A388LMJ2_CHABU|nr:hypothetical protein CBR_g37277 [Chara braunii]|eukprot:GBG83560.1 hypothetical protein CBR_g37277 [Chara braunii]